MQQSINQSRGCKTKRCGRAGPGGRGQFSAESRAKFGFREMQETRGRANMARKRGK